MSAIDLLESQHREVEKLFSQIEKAKDSEKKTQLFQETADKLAIHAAIEEHHFYPAVKAKRTEDILLESLEEHVTIKRTLADLMSIDADDETFDAKVKVLKEEVEHHVGEEEGELFPKVKKILAAAELDALEQEMVAEQEELVEAGEPRASIPNETDKAAPLPLLHPGELRAALTSSAAANVSHHSLTRAVWRSSSSDGGRLPVT